MGAERANFGSKLGIILATAGGAVGLGNVWRFPYMTGENGGATFLLIYAVCVLAIGIPCMISEFIIGRHGASNTARAYGKMESGKKRPSKGWMAVGSLAVFTTFLISGYYSIVSGWCLNYTFSALTGALSGTPEYFSDYFTSFSQHPVTPIVWGILFLGITWWVIIHGVRGGIEKASKILMPVLFILLLIIVAASCMLPDAAKGLEFLFKPDFDHFTKDVFLAAVGQSFFSLSIAMGCIATYASYFSRTTNLASSAIQISVIDSLVAILAGMMIFPAAFSVGINPDSGPSLIFLTLPNVFQEAFGSMPVLQAVIAFAFYALMSLAALTSLISVNEVTTAFWQEEFHTSRFKAATIVTCGSAVLGAISSLSLGNHDWLIVFGKSMFDWFDFITGQIFLPIGGFLTCIFLGWVVDKKVVMDEFTNWGTVHNHLFTPYYLMIRFVCPLAIIAIFLHQFGVL